jgi:sugar O-acyltransferase (sialic acid O-acetyltransferase NeuD family)
MQLYIAGAGGFGRETLDVALALGVSVDAFLDDHLVGEQRRGLPVLSPDAAATDARFVVAIADPNGRRLVVARLLKAGLSPHTLVHPRATVAPEATLGEGCVVLAGAYVSSSVRIGGHVQINYNATVGHDAVLEDYVTVLPGGNVSGACVLRTGATVGANAVVLQGRALGVDAFVGAGAVVTRDVPDATRVAGVPARPLR